MNRPAPAAPRRVRVAVTPADIQRCTPGDPVKCPLAVAITRATGEVCRVGATDVSIGADHAIPLPPAAVQWRRDYDAGRSVQPILFDMGVP